MSTKNTRVDVKILDKDFQVACPESERYALIDAADDLNERMKTVRNNGAIVGIDRIAVMVALNLCYELRKTQAQSSDTPSNASLEHLADKLEHALDHN